MKVYFLIKYISKYDTDFLITVNKTYSSKSSET